MRSLIMKDIFFRSIFRHMTKTWALIREKERKT